MQKLSTQRLTWIDLVRPTISEVDALHHAYPDIHPLNLEDVLSAVERPKIDEGDHYLFVVLHFPVWDPKTRLSRPSEVDFILGRGFLITAHDGRLKPIVQLFHECQTSEAALHKLLDHGPSHALYHVLDRLVDGLFPILRKVDSNINTIEEGVFTTQSRDMIRDIALVRRDVIALRRIIRQQVPIIENLERKERPIIQEDLDEYFGDILDHVYRARDIIDENAEVISGLADTVNSLINNRVNEVIRILTVISVIMLPLTLVSGIYGMNIDLLPFAGHPYSFFIILGFMAIIALVMLLIFRFRNWL